MLDLVLELAGRPAGIAERQDRALGAVAARDRLEDVERRGQADALVDRQSRILDEEVARMQHETALGIDGASLEHLHASGARRKLDQVGGRHDLELHQKIRETDMRRRLIDDDAHRAFGRMGADVDHAASKTLVAHRRHRDQHLTVEIAALDRLARPRPARLRRYRARGRIRIRAERWQIAIVAHAGFATELHVEMLPDWLPIANAAPGRNCSRYSSIFSHILGPVFSELSS